jgi:hypothetical protein
MRARLRAAVGRVQQGMRRLSRACFESSVVQRRNADRRWPMPDETDRRRLDAIVALTECRSVGRDRRRTAEGLTDRIPVWDMAEGRLR